ncbi:MAG: S8 family serine peptidase, partial [Wenzhouxiangella sp.]
MSLSAISGLVFLLVLVLAASPAAASGNWLWDSNGSGIDDRIEAVDALGLEAAFENSDPVNGRLAFAVHEVGGVFRYGVYVQYAYPPTEDDVQRLIDAGVSTEVLHRFRIIDYIQLELSFDEIQTVLGLPGVVRIESVPLMYPTNNNAIETTGVRESNFQRFPTVWEHLGITGKDVVVAVLDTGVNDAPDDLTGYPGHESLIGKFVGGGNFFSGQPALNTGPDESENPIDRGEALASTHGTHVAGTAIGTGGPSGFFSGVARNALLVDLKVLSDAGVGFGSAAGVEWAVLNKDRFDIRILNLSLGGVNNSDGTDAGSQAINAAFDAGILAAIAAGNDGETGWISSPAAADKAVTVGAIQDQNTVTREDDVIASFSNEGPRLDDGTGRVEPRMKPVVAAPGSGVVSADGSLLTDGRQYQSLSGTSMASPVVAGVMALIVEANPELTPGEVVEILKHTSEHRRDWGKTPADANPFPGADPTWHPSGGWGQVDAYAAVKEALRLGGDPASQVQVVYITAAPADDGRAAIDVGWKSQREIELSGYNVLRAPDVGGAPGSFVQVNGDPISGVGEAVIEERENRNEYTFRDADGLVFGETYWYVIEHVSAAGTFQEPAFPVTLGEPVPLARIEYSITHNAIDNDLLTLIGTGTQAARADWIRTGKSAVEADSVTTEPGEPTIGTLRHEFSINLSSLDQVEEFLPPSEKQRWFLSVTEGGFINRSGRVNSFAIHLLDEDGNITESFETGDPTPQQTIEGQSTVLWIPNDPNVVLPGETPVVVEADPEAAVRDSQIEVGIFGAKFLPGATVEVGGAGVEVSSSKVLAGSEIRATFAIAADAEPGPRDI